MQGGGRDELVSPSFRDFTGELPAVPAIAAARDWDSPPRISAVEHDRQRHDHEEGEEEDEEEDASGEEFEFAVALKDSKAGLPIAADELFFGGRISPVYPLFNRDLLLAGAGGEKEAAAAEEEERPVRMPLHKLFLEDREEASSTALVRSSSVDELDGVPPETYCVWTPASVPPSPERRRKSKSTGSASFRWRIRDLVMGRSHSDGKEKFLFFEAAEEKRAPPPEKEEAEDPRKKSTPRRETKAKGKKKEGGKVTELDVITAHGLYYGRGGQAEKAGHRSFLPYKQDLLGFFVNVNDLRRHHHPF